MQVLQSTSDFRCVNDDLSSLWGCETCIDDPKDQRNNAHHLQVVVTILDAICVMEVERVECSSLFTEDLAVLYTMDNDQPGF